MDLGVSENGIWGPEDLSNDGIYIYIIIYIIYRYYALYICVRGFRSFLNQWMTDGMCIPFLARFIGKIRQPLMIHQYSQRGILGWLCPDFIGWVNLGSVDCWLQKHLSLYKNIPAVGRYLYLYLYLYLYIYMSISMPKIDFLVDWL